MSMNSFPPSLMFLGQNNQVKHVNEQFPTLSLFLGQNNQVKHVNEQFPT